MPFEDEIRTVLLIEGNPAAVATALTELKDGIAPIYGDNDLPELVEDLNEIEADAQRSIFEHNFGIAPKQPEHTTAAVEFFTPLGRPLKWSKDFVRLTGARGVFAALYLYNQDDGAIWAVRPYIAGDEALNGEDTRVELSEIDNGITVMTATILYGEYNQCCKFGREHHVWFVV